MDVIQENTVEQYSSDRRYAVLQELGDCYNSIGNCIQAQRCYGKAAVLEPDEPEPYVGLGAVALQKQQLEEARIAFRVAHRLDNDCAKAYCGLAMVYQQRDDFAGAFEMYLKCLELDRDNLIALLGLFQSCCHIGSFSKVGYCLKVYLQIHPSDTAIMFCLASLHVKDGQFNEAKKVLSDALILDPTYSDAGNLLEEVEHELARS